MANADTYTHVRIHVKLVYGETIFFEKFHKETKIDTIFKEVLGRGRNVTKIHIYDK